MGLGLDLQRLEFSSDPTLTPHTTDMVSGARLRIDGRLDTSWRFAQCYIDPEHCVAIALGPQDDAIPSYLATLGVKTSASVTEASNEPAPGGTSYSVEEELCARFETLSVPTLLDGLEPMGREDGQDDDE